MRPKSIFDKNQHGYCLLCSKKTVRSKLGRHIKHFCKEKAKKKQKNLDLYVSLILKIYEPKIKNRLFQIKRQIYKIFFSLQLNFQLSTKNMGFFQ